MVLDTFRGRRNGTFCHPAKKEGVLTKTEKMTNLRSNLVNKGFAVQTP